MKSDWSMDRPIKFGKDASGKQERVWSPCLSMKSDWSMDRHINFGKDASGKQERVWSPCLSMKSDWSMDRPIKFGRDASELTASLLTEDLFRCSVCTEVLEKPVSIPCGHSYCRQCIETYWNQPDQTGEYDCPQCGKRFRTRPDLLTNSALEKVIGKLHQAGFKVPALPSHCYAGPGDVACDLCTEKQLKAVKSCLTCAASYCESHVRHHYTVAALQRHTLVEENGQYQEDQIASRLEARLQREIKVLLHDTEELVSDNSEQNVKNTELNNPAKHFCRGLTEEVLKLQPEKKPVELKGWSDEESEVRSFLQCLPYISQLSFPPPQDQRRSPEERTKREKIFLLNMCLQAALHERGTIQTTVEKLLSLSEVYRYQKCDFLLDLYSHVKDYETQTGRSVLPALQPVYQSAPAVWSIDLSKRKASLLLEVLKLQSEKKTVELKGWSDEESEVRSFLQCLPYISQLSFPPPQDQRRSPEERTKREKIFLLNLCLQAALHERGTIQTTVEKVFSLSEVYHYQKCDFLLDLYSYVKDYETQTGRSVLPALQPVYQSAPAVWSIDLSKRKASLLLEVLKLQPEKKPVELKGWSDEESEVRSFLQCLPYISQLSFYPWRSDPSKRIKFLVDLLSQAAEWEEQTGEKTLKLVSSMCTYSTFPFLSGDNSEQSDFLLDLYSHVKDYETQTGRSVLPALQPVYQSAPAVWFIDLSERKASLLLEVLKLQPEKKPVELKGWSDEESEVRSFLQCLPYISQLSFPPPSDQRRSPEERTKREKIFLLNLCLQAALHERGTIQTTVEKVFSLSKVYHSQKCDFLLDLYSHVKDYETQTGRSVLPALQPVYQSASPAVWSIDLSERKASLLLEVLKLQPEKKPVELKGWSDEESEVRSFLQCLPYISQLRSAELQPEKKPVELKGWSDEESEVRSFLQCLPYISQLSFPPPQDQRRSPEERTKREKIFLLNLCLQAALHERGTIQTTVEKVFSLSKVYHSQKCDFLLDLYSHVKDYETQTGRSVLPALQPVYQSAPAVWSIDLSERKASLLLEVLKLQPEKKPVELKDWSDEESEVRSFLQCLPYISQLSFYPWWPDPSKQIKFLVDLLSQAAEWEEQTGEKTLKLVSSMWTYSTFPFLSGDNSEQSDFLLDLYSHVKDYETQTGRSVLPALQPVYQSAPAVWSIDLSKRKASLLLEVLKLQPEKKPVELKGWSDEESEVRSFLQCLPYISQLSFYPWRSDPSKLIKFLVDLLSQAAEWEEQTGEKTLKLVSSVWTYSTFPFPYGDNSEQSDFLLDLYSHVKDYETQTGRSVLPALQPVYQSAPAVWFIDLSERKASLLLEVLKLQPEKKPVELKGWSDEESEVRSFLQCLPYISQLRLFVGYDEEAWPFLSKLSVAAAENSDFLLDLYSHVKDYETQTGRSVLPALQPVYQSAPAVWSIDLSERKASLLLEVLKLQPEKKPVELKDWSDEESEVRSFLQCLPYISQLSFHPFWPEHSKRIKFLVDLLSQAAEWEEQTGEKTLKLVSSVWTYSTFPFLSGDNSKQSDFLLDLYSHVKDYETQTGRSVLPALQPVYQSAPAVWSIDLSERKASLLLEVLKLQPEKKPVELKGWSDEESEVRSFLQCLPYISQLSCDDDRFFQRVCESVPVRSREEDQQLASLLQALGSTLSLGGELPRKTCRSVGRVLGLCASRVDLTLTPSKISLQGALLIVRHESKLHKLRLNVGMAVKLSRLVRRTGRGATPLTVPELSLVLKSNQPPERVLSRL
ncbi:hypothetical protein J4Q44_G00038130 [Coregonus suidteri]|uniref:RING-type domain-containing protein n=1 Tax=Coregonus suidteri TaxID=861788 RepID=A0AAN8R473_9TELE